MRDAGRLGPLYVHRRWCGRRMTRYAAKSISDVHSRSDQLRIGCLSVA